MTVFGRVLVISQSGNVTDVADMDIAELVQVRVSPFDVSSFLDQGYRASNSVSGSRFDAPIRELPFAVQASPNPLSQTRSRVNIFDIARYSPGVTYRSNDFNEGNANLAIRGFAVSATPGNARSCAMASTGRRSSTSLTSRAWRSSRDLPRFFTARSRPAASSTSSPRARNASSPQRPMPVMVPTANTVSMRT